MTFLNPATHGCWRGRKPTVPCLVLRALGQRLCRAHGPRAVGVRFAGLMCRAEQAPLWKTLTVFTPSLRCASWDLSPERRRPLGSRVPGVGRLGDPHLLRGQSDRGWKEGAPRPTNPLRSEGLSQALL